MKRRQLIRAAAIASAATGLKLAPARAQSTDAGVLKPRRLEAGMTVGVVAPASPTADNERTRFAVDIVRSFGFQVKEGRHLYRRTQYLAGSDRERAEDLMAMFADPAVDAIFCLRGGYGASRILPLLNYDLIRGNPKALIGYSDITALLNAIFLKTGLIGFHGPVANQNFSDYTLAEFRKVLFEGGAPVEIGTAPPFEGGPGRAEEDNRLTVFRGGVARGRLVGGNLSLVSNLIGTPFEPDFRDRILVLEDVDEAPYSIDRMLTQLWLAGRLQQVAGIAFGKFTEAGTSGNSFSVEEVLEQRCADLGVPVVRGFMIGHVEDQTVVPIGAMAELDADAGRLRLLESGVL
jgi:muramoyltetrapeptide carboxypeptidase